MPRPSFSNVRLTIYVTPETAERIRAAAGRRPLGHAVDDAFGSPVPVYADFKRPAPAAFVVKQSSGPPRLVRKPTAPAASSATSPHPIGCACEACTLARLNSPQTRKK